MPLSSLLQDVVDEITAVLSVWDVCALSGTSHHFYRTTIPRRASCARLRTPENIESFCNFMLIHDTRRPLFLRSLVLEYDKHRFKSTTVDVDKLACVVRQATGLRRFCSTRDGSPYISHPAFRDALRTRSTLTSLELCDWHDSDSVLDLLHRMNGQLRYLGVYSCFPPLALSKILEHHASTLEEAYVRFRWMEGYYLHSLPVSCPRLHSLEVSLNSCEALKLFSALPELRSLIIHSIGLCDSPHDHSALFMGWKRLDHFSLVGQGSFPFHWPMRRVTFPIDNVNMDTGDIQEIIHGTRPTVLTITHDDTLICALPKVAPDLKYLEIEIMMSEKQVMLAAEWLRGLSLVGVCFSIDDESGYKVLEIEMEGLAVAIAGFIPTLTSIGFVEADSCDATKEGRYRMGRWFRIARSGAEVPRVHELCTEDGDILEQELLAIGRK